MRHRPGCRRSAPWSGCDGFSTTASGSTTASRSPVCLRSMHNSARCCARWRSANQRHRSRCRCCTGSVFERPPIETVVYVSNRRNWGATVHSRWCSVRGRMLPQAGSGYRGAGSCLMHTLAPWHRVVHWHDGDRSSAGTSPPVQSQRSPPSLGVGTNRIVRPRASLGRTSSSV